MNKNQPQPWKIPQALPRGEGKGGRVMGKEEKIAKEFFKQLRQRIEEDKEAFRYLGGKP